MNFSLAWQTTRACLMGNVGSLMLLVYLGAITVAVLILGSSKASTSSNALLLVFGFPAFFCWAFVSSRLLKILRDADKWLLPAPMKSIVSALCLQAIVTIIIPAALLVLAGHGFFYGMICLTAVAAGGLLFMLLPRYLGISITLLPTLFNKLVAYKILPASNTHEFFAVITVLTLVMVGFALWRFHRLRRFEGDPNAWNTPMALMPDGANGWGLKSGLDLSSDNLITGGVRFEPAIITTPLGSPTIAMRSFLGSPFMPLTTRSQVKKGLLWCIAYLVFPLYMAYSITNAGDNDSLSAAMAAFWVSLLGLGFTFSTVLMRLNMLYTKDNAELTELALLPGWHNGGSAQKLLSKVVSWHIARALLFPFTLALLALAFIKTENHDGFLIILSLFITCVLIGAGFGMNIISGIKPKAWLFVLALIAMFLISMVQLIFTVNSKEFDNAWFAFPGWFVFPLIAIVYCYCAWRLFQTREHPFLRN